MSSKAYEAITQTIIEQLEQADGQSLELPWHKNTAVDLPKNAVTGAFYRGVNILSLWGSNQANGFTSGLWATYRQWASIGGQVRKGEQGTRTIFYKMVEQEETDNEDNRRFFVRSATVFSAEQVEGFEQPPMPTREETFDSLGQVEALINGLGAEIVHGGNSAHYARKADKITMPERWQFRDQEGYYSVLLHELTHWTGHESRCYRDLSGRFGSDAYAFEELVAELGATFMCARLNVSNTPREDHAVYLNSWLKALKNDPKALVNAASLAQRAADYLLQDDRWS